VKGRNSGRSKRERASLKGKPLLCVSFIKVYSCFSRARDLLNNISFFLLIIGFKRL
jgi:hypothetical protein